MNKGWRTIHKFGKEALVLERGKFHILYDTRKHRVLAIYKNKSVPIGC